LRFPPQWLPILAGWLLIFGWLWRDSFRPGWLAFCNDAPYGLMAAFAADRWDHLWHGSWSPLVWLGGPALPLQFSVTHGLYLIAGPVAFGKFAAPLSLLGLAMAGFVLGRTLGFPRWVSFLTSLALGLNGNLLSHAAWGLGARALAVAAVVLSLAALYPAMEPRRYWARTLLAGGMTGLAVVEGADVGALLSLLVAVFTVMQSLLDRGRPPGRRILHAFGRLVVVAAMAALVAGHTMTALIGTQIQGVAVLADSPEHRQARWSHATAWSFPKLEILRFAVPGLMGYRPDTPDGGAYWGCVGWDGTPATRSNGGGEGMGLLVLLMAGWAVFRAAVPGGGRVYSRDERAWIGFWSATAVVSILLAFGQFAPFYRFFYAIPGADTMRMPMKFLHLVHLGAVILAGYGLTGMARQFQGAGRTPSTATTDRDRSRTPDGIVPAVNSWILPGTLGALVLCGISAAAGLRPLIVGHLVDTGIAAGDAATAADFSITEVRWSVTLACLSIVAIGAWRRFGRSPAVGGWMPWILGGLLMLDLGRSASWFIVHYDAARRYQGNAVLQELAATPWAGRVTARWLPDGRATLVPPGDQAWRLLQNQWMEEQFPFLGIQTLDIWQMPRMPLRDAQFLDALRPKSDAELWRIGRLWQLTNVRRVIAPAGATAELNRTLDPKHHGFLEDFLFGMASRAPGHGTIRHPDDLTAVKAPEGSLAVYSMTNSLPRVCWFPCWETPDTDSAVLKRLGDPEWDPATSVLLSPDTRPVAVLRMPGGGSSVAAGTAEILGWTPRRIRARTDASASGILLLNERWDPGWQVRVDGAQKPLLRANHLMRAVWVPEGRHEVDFAYRPPMHTLAISGGSWIAILATLLLEGRASRVPIHTRCVRG